MSKLELELRIEQLKRKAADNIKALNEKWEQLREQAAGNPEAETKVIEAKLSIQLMERNVLDELAEIEEQLKATED